MPSNYKGLYVIRVNGVVTDVQVEDTGGNSLALPIDKYCERGVEPDWRLLPPQEKYPLIDSARQQAQQAANHYQYLVDLHIDELRILQRSDWKDERARARLDDLVSKMAQARVESDRLADKYLEVGGLQPIFVQSRQPRGF